MDGRKSSMFRKSADRALIGEVNYSLRFCPTYVCNLPIGELECEDFQGGVYEKVSCQTTIRRHPPAGCLGVPPV